MALIGRFLVVTFGFLMACFVTGTIAVFALLFPEMTDISVNSIDSSAVNLIIGFGFVLFSGFALSPAVLRSLTAETTAHYHSRFTPIYTRSESGGTDYDYTVERYSYARVRIKYDFSERLSVTNDFYAYHDGFFDGDRKGPVDRRYRNVLRMSCRL